MFLSDVPMASTKISALTQITNTTADDLLLISSTLDAGTSYDTRAIKVSDLLDDLGKADLDIDDLEALTGMGAGATDLGTFNGDQIPDGSTIKAALQSLEDGLASAVSGGVLSGSNVNQLVAATAAETEPTSWLFLVVDTADGAIKAIDKTFLEIE